MAEKVKPVRAWAIDAWLVASGDTPRRVYLTNETVGLMFDLQPDEAVYPITIRPAPKRRKPRKKA